MHLWVETSRLLATASWGLFAGAMLTEGRVLVPAWRALPAAQFFAWYQANDRRLLAFFSPLTIVTALLAAAAAATSFWTGDPGRWLTLLSVGIALLIVASFPLYFRPANARFSAAALAENELRTELARWARWHACRTGLSLCAFGALLGAG